MYNKFIYILIACLGVIGVAVYCNYFLGIDVVYTHLFYLIIIMVGFWFSRYTLPAALFLGLLHITLEYISSGIFSIHAILRVLIMLLVAIIVSKWRNKLDIKEKELQSLNEVLNLLLDNIPNLLTIYDRQGKYFKVSKMTAKTLGRSPVETEGKYFSELLTPAVAKDFMNNTEKLLKTKQSFSVIDEIETGEGNKIFETRLFPLKYSEHEIELIGALGIDITDRKKAEQKIKEAYQELEQIIELLPDATFVINSEGQVIFWNRAIEEMTGVSKEQMIGKANYEYAIPFYGRRCPMLIDYSLLPFDEHHKFTGKYDFVHEKDGVLIAERSVPEIYKDRQACLLESASKLNDLSGNVIGAIQSIRDITDRKKMEELLFYEKEELRVTLLSIGDGFISTDKQGNVLLLNKVAEDLTGWSSKEALGKPLEEVFNIINEFSGERCEDPAKKVLETGNIIELANHTILISKDGIGHPIEDSAAPIKNRENNIIGVVIVFRDFSAKKERLAQIEYLSFHDQLTGLHNRRFYNEELKRLDTGNKLPLTLVIADVNGLKLVNDAFGHLQGDKILLRVAEIIKQECRTGDIVARIGGDEFIILLPKTERRAARHFVDRIKTAISNERIELIKLSVSFGWATKNRAGEDIEKVFKQAEDHMYQHKLYESPSMRSNTIKTIIKTLYEKLPGEKEHSDRVSQICEKIGHEMGYNTNEIAELKTAALLHDIGKIILSDSVINKADDLTDSEWAEVKRHPEIGYRILSSVNEMSQLAEYVLAHHENWDGSGCPKGLKGYEIPQQSRIIRIADAYDAMVSSRFYHKSFTKEEAIKEINTMAGIQFDPDIAKLFEERVLSSLA